MRGSILPSIVLLTILNPALGQVNVLTQHNDNQRTGANLSETVLTTSNVNVDHFGKLFTRPVDGHIYAQPLYVSNLSIGGGTHNVVFVATAHDSVYAFDGDDGVLYWHASLGTPVPSGVINTPNIPVEVGIISTPVIDPSTSTIYVVAKTYESSVQIHRLHALSLTTGVEKFGGPVQIAAQVNGSGDGGSNGVVPFVSSQENQRSALTLANGNVYMAFASHEDYSPYHGWILSYNKTTLQQNAVFNDTPNGGLGGIWMAGTGLTVDANGNVYCMTGNGTSDAQSGGVDYGECFLKLSPTLSVLDWFMPNDFDNLNAWDADLGSSGPMMIPGTNDLIGGGKEGILYLVNTSNMGHENGVDLVLQEWQAVSLNQPGSHHIHGAPIYYHGTGGTYIYLWGENDALRQFQFNGTGFNSTATSTSAMLAPEINTGMPGGTLSISANGATAGSGIVWATTVSDNDAIHAIVSGVVRAFDAADVSHELWNSRQDQARDDIGVFAKNCAPTVANGKVYVGTFNKELAVYGLNPPTPAVTQAISVDFQGNASSAMAPGETAGVVAVAHWNNAAAASGSASNLVDSAGTSTTAGVSWTSDNNWSTGVSEAAGNARMMKGYLDTGAGNGSTTTVTVTGLPAAYSARPYTVYVYLDGDNGGAWRTGAYTIGSTTIDAVDMGIDFGGIFARAVNSEGNYLVFPGLTGTSFTLTATGVDDIFRAPVNGIQIIANGDAAPPSPTGLTAHAGA